MVWPTQYDVKLEEYDAMPLPGQQINSSDAETTLDHAIKLDMREPPGVQRLTCIAASIGSSSSNVQVLEQLMAAGMNIAIVTLYFLSMEENLEIIRNIRKAARSYSVTVGRMYPLAIGVRLTGKKIRTGKISETYGNTVEIRTGESIRLTTDETYRSRCSSSVVFVDYLYFISQIKIDDYIVLDNDLIVLKVTTIGPVGLMCTVERGGTLGSYKDVVVPYTVFNMPNITDRDKEFIKMAVEQQVDIIIPSLVNNDETILEVRNLLGEKGKRICIMADVQTVEGYRNFDSICSASDAIMLSRQELGNVISQKNMLIAMKHMVARANMANVAVFVSAQFLTSMRYKKVPLRSELLDIGNSVLDGADGLVLSGETAVGLYPVEATMHMAQSCKEAEACIWSRKVFQDSLKHLKVPVDPMISLGLASVLAANRMVAAAIVILTQNLDCAKTVSRFRPRCPIIAVTRHPQVARQLNLFRGIIPLCYEEVPEADWQNDVEKRVMFAIKWAMQQGFVRIGDPYVVLSGWRSSTTHICNMRVDMAKG